MDKQKQKTAQKKRRQTRIRAKIKGTQEKPRFSVYKSNKSMFLQLIDDVQGITLVSVSPKEIKKSKNKTDLGEKMGAKLAEKAKEKNIAEVVFDRGGCPFHGRVKAVAEAAKEQGLKF
ncbi:MAG: 50S ribosomal protein L18 [Patescibacteria group bacterium]